MRKRKYTKIQALLAEIKGMLSEGKSHGEIERQLGLTGDRQIHNLLKRERPKEAKATAGIVVCAKGRPRKSAQCKDVLAEQAYEIHRLKMENQLLRGLLQFTGRK